MTDIETVKKEIRVRLDNIQEAWREIERLPPEAIEERARQKRAIFSAMDELRPLFERLDELHGKNSN